MYIYANLYLEIMGTLELREELRKYIETADGNFLKALHKTAKSYIEQKHYDKMIAEGEEDIKAGRIHSQAEVKKMIESWTEKKSQ